MRAPGFWSNPPEDPGWQARLLAPLAAIYDLARRCRMRSAVPVRADVPVVCVGNLTAGGAGKTPTVAALVRRLQAAGLTPHVLSRGYGGALRGPHRVDPERDSFREVGDEPLLLAAIAPVWVARDRAAGAAAAVAAGAQMIVMDDGFQNPSLAKDLNILVVDAGQGFGNGRLMPAGPLREKLAEGLARTDLAILIGARDARAATLARWPQLASVPLVEARLSPVETGLSLEGEKVVAFAGIGRPEKFFATLDDLGARRVASHAFADHYPYPEAVLKRLVREARQADAMLVTTEKDAARLPASLRREVVVAQVALAPEDWSVIDSAVGHLGLNAG